MKHNNSSNSKVVQAQIFDLDELPLGLKAIKNGRSSVQTVKPTGRKSALKRYVVNLDKDFLDKHRIKPTIHGDLSPNPSTMPKVNRVGDSQSMRVIDKCDQQNYSKALADVNAKKIAAYLAQVPTIGNEKELYVVVKALARLRVTEIINGLPEDKRYKNARTLDPEAWITTVVRPELETVLHPALFDVGIYADVGNFHNSLLLLRKRKAKANEKLKMFVS